MKFPIHMATADTLTLRVDGADFPFTALYSISVNDIFGLMRAVDDRHLECAASSKEILEAISKTFHVFPLTVRAGDGVVLPGLGVQPFLVAQRRTFNSLNDVREFLDKAQGFPSIGLFIE